MVAVQATHCAPIVRAFEQGLPHAEPFPNAHTVASGLRVPAAIGDFLMLTRSAPATGRPSPSPTRTCLAGTVEMSQMWAISSVRRRAPFGRPPNGWPTKAGSSRTNELCSSTRELG